MSFDPANAKIVEWADGAGMFKRAEDPASRVISLGAGVQSTTMALMAAHGEIGPMPDCAIFADTGWEPKAVYDHLNWLMSDNVLPFPVHIISKGSIRDMLTQRGGHEFSSAPFFIKHPDGTMGMGSRQCTGDYKIKPLRKKMRALLNKGNRERIAPGSVEMWIGISTDEAGRVKPSGAKWLVNHWPLISAGMSRQDCLNWMDARGYPRPPKSACIGCPFHNDAAWREMKETDPVSWADAVDADRAIRSGAVTQNGKIRGEQYMHRSGKPLDDVDLDTAEDHGQLNFFINECEGMCGV